MLARANQATHNGPHGSEQIQYVAGFSVSVRVVTVGGGTRTFVTGRSGLEAVIESTAQWVPLVTEGESIYILTTMLCSSLCGVVYRIAFRLLIALNPD